MTDPASPTLAFPYPWQQPQWQRIQQLLKQSKLPHALMLSGQQGVGKLHFATAIAQYLLCITPRNGLACGSCRGCGLNQAGTHPDFLNVQPELVGKSIKVDQVRELANFIAKTSQQGGMKLAVIAPAEAMNINAANALLKSLEEPAGDTLLLLVCHSPSRVMATVRSRCQLMSFAIPPLEQTVPWLSPLVHGEDPESLLQAAGYAPLTALGFLDGEILEQRESLLSGLISVAEGKISALDAAVKCMNFDPLSVLDWVIAWLQLGAKQLAGLEQEDKRLTPLFSQVPPNHLYRYFDKVIIAKRQLLSGANPNKQLLLEELFMDWSALLQTRQSARNGLS